MIAALFDRLRRGDRNALARLISLAARGERLGEIQQSLNEPAERIGPHASSRVVAFTGSGGVGKSTLIGKLISLVRQQSLKVAVLACDPQSPLTGGALLGDRFRMGSSTDDGVFIRSLAAVSGHGGLAEHLEVIIRLLGIFGFDVIFLETVGSGQGDVDVRKFSDVVVLLVQPESGDDVQWEKAGILEFADLVVVHKADLPGADQTAAQVRTALDLSGAVAAPVLRVSTKANSGHAELWQSIQALPARQRQTSDARLLLEATLEFLKRRFYESETQPNSKLEQVAAAWQRGETPTPNAIESMVSLLVQEGQAIGT